MMLAAVPGLAAADQVAMPFQCKLDRGRVVLSPSPVERVYEVYGEHRQKPHLFCAVQGERRCRSRIVHRFDVMCGNARTSWVSVAAAATRLLGQEAWIDAGRLNVVVGAGTTVSRSDCGESGWPRSLTQAFSGSPAFDRPCNSRIVERGGPRVITLPVGFAPLSELGARLLEVAPKPVPQVAHVAEPAPVVVPAVPAAIPLPPLPPPGPAVAPPNLLTQAAVVPQAPVPSVVAAPISTPIATPVSRSANVASPQPPPEQDPFATASRQVAMPELHQAARWVATVHPNDGPAAALVRLRAALATEQWLFAIGLLTATLAVGGLTLRTVGRHSHVLTRRRRSSASLDQLVRRASLVSLDDPDERVLSDLRTTAEQL